MLASSCAPTRKYPLTQGDTAYRPPTLSPTQTQVKPTPVTSSTESAASSSTDEADGTDETDNCDNVLRFIDDLTIPDNTELAPGSTLDKRWEVENAGSCNWNDQYGLRLVSGPAMEAQTEQKLYPARSGTRVPVRIIFTTPQTPGNYTSAWQAFTPNGVPFGDQIYITIIVVEAPPEPTAEPIEAESTGDA